MWMDWDEIYVGPYYLGKGSPREKFFRSTIVQCDIAVESPNFS